MKHACWVCGNQTQAIGQCNRCTDLLQQIQRAGRNLEYSPEIANCDLFTNIALPYCRDGRYAADTFFFGWMCDEAAANLSMNDRFMDRTSFLSKFGPRQGEEPEAVFEAVSKVTVMLRAEYGERDFSPHLALALIWYARALEVQDEQELALIAILDRIPTIAPTEFPVGYMMARLIARYPEDLIWRLVEPYWSVWGHNWKVSLDNRNISLALTVLITHSIKHNPVLYYLVQRDSAFDSVRLTAESAMEMEKENFRGRIRMSLTYADMHISNLRMRVGTGRYSLLESWFTPEDQKKRREVAGACLREIEESKENVLIREIEKHDDFLTLVRGCRLAQEFEEDVEGAYKRLL